MHKYRYYKESKSGLALYWLGNLFFISGIGNVTGRHLLLGIFTIALAFLLEAIAEDEVEKQLMRRWKQNVNEEGIRTSIVEAVQAYNLNPCQRSVDYICALNPKAADYIRQNAEKNKR